MGPQNQATLFPDRLSPGPINDAFLSNEERVYGDRQHMVKAGAEPE